jgi:hypothetical protein
MEVDMGQVLIDGVLQGAGGFLRYRIRAEKAKGPGGSLSRDEFERLSGKLELLEIKPKKGA